MAIRSVKSVDLAGKIVLLRTDYNVPMKDGLVTDNTRILETISNLRYLVEAGVKKIVIVTHLGRPDGIRSEEYSLKPVVRELEKLMGDEIVLISEAPKELTKSMIENAVTKIVVLENIRFEKGEEAGDDDLAKSLAQLADVFVLDGFSVAHRDHASVTRIAKFLPTYAGLTLLKEWLNILDYLNSINRPFLGIFGGIKLTDKIPVIRSLVDQLDGLMFGSSVATAFLKQAGFGVGSSMLSGDSNQAVSDLKELLQEKKINIYFPNDLVIGNIVTKQITTLFQIDMNQVIDGSLKPFDICTEGEAIFDIGEGTLEKYKKVLDKYNTIFWNGPLGYSEEELFANGTTKMALYLSEVRAKRLVGGGDTVAIISKMQIDHKFDYVSTSGGAMLEFIAKRSLPGLESLVDNN